MDLSMDENLKLFVLSHPLAREFVLQQNGKQFSDINQYVAEFEVYCRDREIKNFDNTLWFKILYEKLALRISDTKNDSYKIGDGNIQHFTLSAFNSNLKLDEYDLDDFIFEWESRKTEERKYTDEQSKRYKSYRECWLYEVYTYDDQFLEKYKHAAHPLIQSTIGKALIANGEHKGIGYLFNALTRAVVMPNIYWNNEKAIIGYIEALWEIIRLCQLAKINGNEERINEPQLFLKLIRLLFLYMSRYIELNPDNIKTADIYSNRAELFYFFPSIMQSLFCEKGFPAIITDLQFSADKFLAFRTASRTHPELVSGFYLQCLWDAKKMYQYGNLNYPTIDGDYTVIEDASFMEIIERCRIRSRIVAQQFLDEDMNGNIYLTKMQVQNLFGYVISSEVDLHKDLMNFR